jgi:hypothetical protein
MQQHIIACATALPLLGALLASAWPNRRVRRPR